MGCSGLPYAQRLKMQHQVDIVDCRDHAARIAMYCTSMALHDVFGFGPDRQRRLTDRIKEISTRYKHQGQGFLLEEMSKLGFAIVDGKAMVFMGENGNIVKPNAAEVTHG